MATNIKMGKFLKQNVLDTISRKYKFNPERSLPYLKEISTQLKEVQELIDETSNYMCEVERIKEEDDNKEFLNRQTDEPFK
jgi:DNA repair ATPase RecN